MRRGRWALVLAFVVAVVLGLQRRRADVTAARDAPAPAGAETPEVRVRPGVPAPGDAPSASVLPTPPVPPPPEVFPATEEGVQSVIDVAADFLPMCFSGLAAAGLNVDAVTIVGRIGSIAKHGSGPRGFVEPVTIRLPDGSAAPETATHCFNTMVNARGYETPTLGSVPFEVDVDRP